MTLTERAASATAKLHQAGFNCALGTSTDDTVRIVCENGYVPFLNGSMLKIRDRIVFKKPTDIARVLVKDVENKREIEITL